jgi:signal transduction histidine kinase
MKKYFLLAGLFCLFHACQLDAKNAAQPTKISFEDFHVNIEQKRKEIVNLVQDGIDYLLKHRVEEAFYAFLNSRRFTKGEVTLFVYDTSGTVYVQENTGLLWQNIKDKKNAQGINVFELLMKKIESGGGWVEYEWNNDFQSSYVERIEKNGVTYIVGAGWFPATKQDKVISMVKTAVHNFNTEGRAKAFGSFSNPVGQFISGNTYIYAYDTKGYSLAHGDNIALIGRNFFNLRDDEDKFFVQALIQKAQDGGGWVNYVWSHAPKLGYVELVKDKDGTYIIGSGYHPNNKRSLVVSMVKRGTKYFNSWGRERAAREFNNKQGEFIIGDLALFMYDFKGNVLSQGDYLSYVGQNLYNFRSPSGDYIIQNLLGKAEAGGGWISYEWANDLAEAYVEKVTDKEDSYVIGAAFYPDTKKENIEQLVNRAIGYLRTHSKQESIYAFSKDDSDFVKGSSSFIFMFTLEGDCLVYGYSSSFTWKNFKKFQDVEGKHVFKSFVNKVTEGGGWVRYQSRNATKFAYVTKVVKDNVPYIIGSSYYK